jgi:hypothetical protein
VTETLEVTKIAMKQELDGTLVTFRIQNDDLPLAEELFKAAINARFAMAIVPIDDQEQPKPKTPAAEKAKKKQNSNVMRAGILCGEEGFQTFLRKKYPDAWKGGLGEGETKAADALRSIIQVDSRREIGSDPEALARWDALQANYEMWKRGQ